MTRVRTKEQSSAAVGKKTGCSDLDRVLLEGRTEGALECCTCLADMDRTGEGVTADAADALRFGKIAAEKGHEHAMVLVGEMLERREGTAEERAGTRFRQRPRRKDCTQEQVSWDQKRSRDDPVEKGRPPAHVC
jgi:TPR repeat protein